MHWKLAEAKNKLSEVVRLALTKGPQYVDKRQDSVVIISLEEYEKLKGNRKSLKEFLLTKGPSLEGINLNRDRTSMRETKL